MVFAIANAVVEDHNETTGCLFQEATQMVKCLDAISFPGWHDWNTEFGVSLGGPVSLRKFRIFFPWKWYILARFRTLWNKV